MYVAVTNRFFYFLGPQAFKNIIYNGYIGTLSYFVFGYLCICEFLFVNMTVQNIIFHVLGSLAFKKYKHILGISGTFSYGVFVHLCICVLTCP